MKMYHTVQKTIEKAHMLRSGMSLFFNSGLKKEWFTVKAQGFSEVQNTFIVSACNASVGIIIDGKTTLLYRIEDNKLLEPHTWKPKELQAALPGSTVFYPVYKVDSNNSLCIFIPEAIHEKREVKINDIIYLYVNSVNTEWVVKSISVDFKVTAVNAANKVETVCIHPDNKELMLRFNLEYK